MNDNAFYLFDENKPAWLAPTTIPHTLVASMVNLAGLGRARKGQKPILADPFVGAGTTWLEALKFKPFGLGSRCSDKAPIARLLAADNLEFFSADVEKIDGFLETLNLDKLKTDILLLAKSRDNPDNVKAYLWAERLVRSLERDLKKMGKEGNFSLVLTPEKISELTAKPLKERLFFYLLLRASLLNIAAFKRDASAKEIRNLKSTGGGRDLFSAFIEQAEKLVRQIGLLKLVRAREFDPRVKPALAKKSEVVGFKLFTGKFSLAYSMDFAALSPLLETAQQSPPERRPDWDLIQQYDVTAERPNGKDRRKEAARDINTLKPKSCDVIITDPPYGFNTDEDAESLAKLYAEALSKMIGALKENGQLVLCLLDRSHTGRRSPFFSHKEIIIQQVLAIADKMSREVIIPAFAVPHQREIFRPPYYWESERALRRAILHFKFRTKA